MELILESREIKDYLEENEVINYSHPSIQNKIMELCNAQQSDIDKTKAAFEFVRDHISHSWDIQSKRVVQKASDVLHYREGICYAKSNLLCALLRGQGIPTGFCYQRLMLFDTPDQGYSLHAFNAVYLASLDKWVRLDARGNKPGVQAEFSIEKERLAFRVNEALEEKDYPIIFSEPNQKTMSILEKHSNAIDMYQHGLPDDL